MDHLLVGMSKISTVLVLMRVSGMPATMYILLSIMDTECSDTASIIPACRIHLPGPGTSACVLGGTTICATACPSAANPVTMAAVISIACNLRDFMISPSLLKNLDRFARGFSAASLQFIGGTGPNLTMGSAM